jgi:bacillolysin
VKSFLKEQVKAPGGTDFYLYKQEKDPYGNTHEKYQQTYRGIKIEGKELMIHKNKEGSITTIDGDYDSIPEVNIKNKISFDQALTRFKSSRSIKESH